MKTATNIHFVFDMRDFCSLSTGAELTPSVALDMLNVQSERGKAYDQFMEERLSENVIEDFILIDFQR